MDRAADSLPDDIDTLRALALNAIAERDAAIAERDQLIAMNDKLRQLAVVTPPSPVGGNEIELAGKYRIRVSSGVDARALRRVLDVLERR